ncbi:MAG: polysaccharide pyruvyl transferase family protein, partial [Muribaculaceae bacterium]
CKTNNKSTMKIGILTQPLETNYGGILQNYALQKILCDMGHIVYTIDRHNDAITIRQILSYIKRNLARILLRKTVSGKFRFEYNRREMLYVTANMQQFIQANIKTTSYISSNKKLKKIKSYNFDCYVVGSDQIWIPFYTPEAFISFDKRPNVRRIAYAASFGVDYWNYDKQTTRICKDLAKRFNAISVREDSSVQLCQQYLNIKPTVVLDPTLLLSATDYLKLILPNDISKDSNLLMSYILDYTEDKYTVVENVCKIRQLTKHEVYPLPNQSMKTVIPSISKWLAGFYTSKFVVTDSFHGLVFSLIFNKPFVVIGNESRGLARFTSILKLIHMEDRLIMTHADVDRVFAMDLSLDFSSINKILYKEKVKSMSFIEDALNSK